MHSNHLYEQFEGKSGKLGDTNIFVNVMSRNEHVPEAQQHMRVRCIPNTILIKNIPHEILVPLCTPVFLAKCGFKLRQNITTMYPQNHN